MKGDFTRDTFDPTKHYEQVLMQQGRVQLDADWNEQAAINAYRDRTLSGDLIGRSGGPVDDSAFAIISDEEVLGKLPTNPKLDSPIRQFALSKGHYYVDGIQCRVDRDFLFSWQPDFRTERELGAGRYLLYLDAWERHITALDDPALREPALGGPDTASRVRTVWQVRAKGIEDSVRTCAEIEFRPSFVRNKTEIPTLTARTAPPTPTTAPCPLPPTSGYQGFENQLYRIEIHDSGDSTSATYKWSRDNGAFVSAITKLEAGATGTFVTISTPGTENCLGFRTGDLVEWLDDTFELESRPGLLARLKVSSVGNRFELVWLNSADPSPSPDLDLDFHPKLRRWDGFERVTLPHPAEGASPAAGFRPIESGIEISFNSSGAEYRTGDYWLIPARAATATTEAGDIEWPRQPHEGVSAPVPEPPRGIEHHFARLAVITIDSDGKLVTAETEPGKPDNRPVDCRNLWSPLAAPRLVYVSGDGQQVMPDLRQERVPPLREPLVVAVLNGHCGAGRIKLRFQCRRARGSLAPASLSTSSPAPADPPTDATDSLTLDPPTPNALIAVYWWLDYSSDSSSQQVEVVLFDDAAEGKPQVAPPLIFNANLSVAHNVAYVGPESCSRFSEVRTVAGALDRLREQRSLHPLVPVHLRPEPDEEAVTLKVRATTPCGPLEGAIILWQRINGDIGETLLSSVSSGAGEEVLELPLTNAPPRQVIRASLEDNPLDTQAPSPRHVDFVIERPHQSDGGVRITQVRLVRRTELVPLGAQISYPDFLEGIEICLDGNLSPASIMAVAVDGSNPTFDVSIQVPFPLEESTKNAWGGVDYGMVSQTFNLLGDIKILPGTSEVSDIVRWTLTDGCRKFLERAFQLVRINEIRRRLLLRVTLKGNFILDDSQRLHLDGDAFAAREGDDPIRFESRSGAISGDGRRGGDFEIWCWLTPDPSIAPIPDLSLPKNQRQFVTFTVIDPWAEFVTPVVVTASSDSAEIPVASPAFDPLDARWTLAIGPVLTPRSANITVRATGSGGRVATRRFNVSVP